MRKLLSGSLFDIDGSELHFWYYDKRTVSQHIDIEQIVEKRGNGETTMLMAAFIVLALDEEGKRLFPVTEWGDLITKIPHDELVKACLTMGGVRESVDPKA